MVCNVITITWFIPTTLHNHACHSQCHDPISSITWLPRHMPKSSHTPTCTPDPDMLCYIIVAHSDSMCSCLLCIAPVWNYIHSFSYLVIFPLWSYAPMLSFCYMFPSICFMLTFPITPQLSLILLWNLIQSVFIFKLLVSTCNDHYNHMIHHHINTRPCCHDPIFCNHVTLPAHVPEPIHFPTCAPILICCVTFLWHTPPNTCPRLYA